MGINEQQLDISGLLPDFFSFPSFETASDLSAIFVVALITLFFIFLLIAVIHSWKANRRIKWLNNVLSQENEDTVFNSRSDLRNKALKRNGTEAHLWCEFDETLIEVKEGEQHKLCNVYDADYFFNAASLAPGITESRLIAAVPGFLTAIGVIGTFVGLQLGLSQLNIGNDVAVDEMKDGLAYVISGAKFAFMTSVWGVLLSVLFNFIEKCLENGVRKQIRELQVTIDKIFPRLTAEMQLKRIADDGGESREALQGLAEKIGDKMQESLLEVTAGIQQGLEQSLQNVMGPAMDRLVNDASDGSQRAMEQLIESFMDKFGQQGTEQRNSMDQASKGVSDAVDSMNQALNGFISNLNQNQQAASEREQGLIRHIAEQIDSMADHNRYQQQEFLASTHAQVKAVRDVLNQHQTAAGQREQELVEHISSQVDKLVSHTQQQAENITRVTGDQLGNMSELFQKVQEKQSERERALGLQFESTIAEIKTTMQKQIEATQNLLSDSRQLQEDMANNSQSLQRLASSIHEGATELARSTTQLKEYGATLQQASTKLSTSIFSASESTEYLASENHKAAESVRMVRDQIQSAITVMERTVGNLDQMVQLADGSFKALEQHQNNYLAALKKNIGELAEQGTRLLSDYAEQANGQTRDHLKIWAQSANDYAAQMNNAANALSSVVDEIETKVGN